MGTKFVQSDGKEVLLAHARVEPIKGPIAPEPLSQPWIGIRRVSKNTLQKPWPELVVGHYDRSKKNNFGGANPYCVAFVYAKSGNIVVRGMPEEIDAVLCKERRFGNCVYYETFWGHREQRGMWSGTPGIYVSKRSIGNRMKFCIEVVAGCVGGKPKWVRRYFRRMPRRWIKLYDMVSGSKILDNATPDEPPHLDLEL